MHRRATFLAGVLIVVVFGAVAVAQDDDSKLIRLASTPALSPDGKTLVVSWQGDLWSVSSEGGDAQRLTHHPGLDAEPVFSPDGKQLAFTSDRDGSRQVYVMPATGGVPRQITFHTEGYSLQDWYPDGRALLVSSQRDHFWRHAQRFFRVALEEPSTEELLFDDYGANGRLDRRGNRLLFTREGTQWWRKGYRGSQASQVWLYNIADGKFQQLCNDPSGCRFPIWAASGDAFYYVSGKSGAFNLWRRSLRGKQQEEQLTFFEDDSVVVPCISRDGSTIVFRHLFDFYRLRPGRDQQPVKLTIRYTGDHPQEDKQRRTLESASEVAFSSDGLEVAFISGGDVWVMDTVLREPRQVTNTPGEERSLVFAPDNQSLLFVSDHQGQPDIWRAERADADRYWWQNDSFKLTRLTNDPEPEFGLRFDPTGKLLAFLKVRGDLWVMKSDGTQARRVFESWNDPEYDFSPDGRWLVYAVYDNDFNRDIWLLPLDGSREPFNLSRHPDNDSNPVWSPDGKRIAYTGRRSDGEIDIYIATLRKAEGEETSRDRKVKEALEKLNKARKKESGKTAASGTASAAAAKAAADDQPVEAPAPGTEDAAAQKPKEDDPSLVKIDFEGIHDRIQRVNIPGPTERNLFWKYDSKKLAFTATIDGKEGIYTIDPPGNLKPTLLTTSTGTQARWIESGNQVLWLSGAVPASLDTTKGTQTRYTFQARQEVDLPGKREAAFVMAWRAMRDRFYDGNLNNRNWDAIRRKYADMARNSGDSETLARVINLMLGELNASHMGFFPTDINVGTEPSKPWPVETAHLGLRFDATHRGPGWKVRDVIPGSPADREKSQIKAGEIVLTVDGTAVDPGINQAPLLNGPLDRDIRLTVQNAAGEQREVTLRPISYREARQLLYDAWVDYNRQLVEKASDGKLGYLHVQAMNMPSFYRFEAELYDVGVGKDGLIIDVRENGGGSTTDHLLTALTQPRHAITVPRGGGRGYPQDRTVYATWHKPIVVLCNQNSFSNAEIFSHAIKLLGRGELVGVTTAGGVISTGAMRVMDLGILRMPVRGWYGLRSGQDMELNGAEPHHIVWPQPGEMPAGKDVQLEKAIEVLGRAVEKWRAEPQVELINASQRDRK